MYAYVVLSLLIGARPGDLRALTWDHVELVGKPEGDSPVPPHVACDARSGHAPGRRRHEDPEVPAYPRVAQAVRGGAPAAPGPAGIGTPGATPTYPFGLNLPAGLGETSDLRHHN
jgi:hypothetical protein